MAFKINDFRTHFSKNNEFARADKFEAWITVSNPILQKMMGTKELALQCEISELPGRAASMIEFRHHAFVNRIPHYNVFQDVNFTFYCNGNMTEKKFFDQWMDLMVPVQTGLVNYFDETAYATEIKIKQYGNTVGKDGKPEVIYECTLIDAIPTSIAPLALNWQDDSIQRLQVNFAYKKWYPAGYNPIPVAEPAANYGNSTQPTASESPNTPKKEETPSITGLLGSTFSKGVELGKSFFGG